MKRVARESFRMSYSGLRLVTGTTKTEIEHFFVSSFPMQDVWDNASKTANTFDKWHKHQVQAISERLDGRMRREDYIATAIAAKFLNTFLHQLMKYGKCRSLWKHLHLPLDRIVFDELKALSRRSVALKPVASLFDKSPYSITPKEYRRIQISLKNYMNELNGQPAFQPALTSRIEFNAVLWSRK